jgi:hypothetical protein
MSDGKQLEALVAFVEKTLLPQGFEVKTNTRVYDDEGGQIAEFDIEIRGKVGSTALSWLIECRDRPAKGPQPGAWIKQLVGRRGRFGFNKVTAVSTTGFAAGAAEYAKREGIELREVRSLTSDAFDWLALRGLREVKCMTSLQHADLLVDEAETEERRNALALVLSQIIDDVAFLRSTITGEMVPGAVAFLRAVESVGTLFDGLEANGPRRKITLNAQYTDADRFEVQTPVGAIPIRAIVYTGELLVEEKVVPLVTTAQYRQADSGEVISELAAFAPQEFFGQSYAMEMHRMGKDGETHVIFRRVGR